MVGTSMWLNEINYFSGPSNVDFIKVGIPVDNNFRPAFSIVVYDKLGNHFATVSQPALSGVGLVNNGINYVKIEFPGLGHLPDDGIAVALLRDDGFVRQFISFGAGGPVTAIDGPLAGSTSAAVLLSDTNLVRNIGLTGSAFGPEGWTWTANVANLIAAKQNVGQFHTPSLAIPLSPIMGTGGNNVMYGSTKQDYLLGEGGNDTLYGLIGADILDGGEGNDILVGGMGGDTLIGGNGTDLASYFPSAAGVTLNLATGVHLGDAKGDTFNSIENFRLTQFGDTFTMSDDGIVGSVNLDEGDDTFNGGAGADRAYGGDGVDTLYGGGGADRLEGQAGNDFVFGGDEADTIRGDTGNDELYGDAGNDLIFGGNDHDKLYGGADNDDLQGEEGNDELYGGEGNDRLNGGIGNDDLHGEAGNDEIRGGSGTNNFWGGDGDDQMFATAAATDTFYFDDQVYEGLDRIYNFTVGEDALDFGTAMIVDTNDTGSFLALTLNTGTEIRLVGVTFDQYFGS